MEKQRVLQIQPNRLVKWRSIPVEGDAIVDRPNMSGVLRIREYIGKVSGFKKWGFLKMNTRIMVTCDGDGYPLSPYRPTRKEIEALCKITGDDKMAARAAAFQLGKNATDEKKLWFQNSLAYAGMGIVFVTLVLIVMAYSGKISLQVPG